MLNIGVRMREERDKRHLSRVALSKKLKVSEGFIYSLEKGYRYPNYSYVNKAARLFGMDKSEAMSELIAQRIMDKYGKVPQFKKVLEILDEELNKSGKRNKTTQTKRKKTEKKRKK